MKGDKVELKGVPMYGWAGTILNVDLNRGKVVKIPLSKETAVKYIGSRGLNAKILYDKVGPEVQPLSPENVLIFGVGPANGTLAPGSNRFTVTALSTYETFGDGNSGGSWGAMLKYAGYDAIVFHGKSSNPVYLWIDDEFVELRDASHLWGKTTWGTDDVIKEEIGDPDISVVSIGPAGENLVKYACVISDRNRAAARCGIGAVMGSKNLKAIGIRGSGKVSVADPDLLIETCRENLEALLSDEGYYKAFSTEGSPSLTSMYNLMGALPTRNFQTGVFGEADKLSGKRFLKDFVLQRTACHGCQLHCSHIYKIEEGPYSGIMGEGLEYETICGFGSRCGNDNLASTIMAHELCNKYGLDTISTSGTIAFAMECFERGLLSLKDTGNVELRWGDHALIIDLVSQIANRKGFGDVLAEGSWDLAQKIGDEAKKFAPVVKGMELINVDPRGPKAWALGFAVSTRGADHLRAFPVGEFHFPPEFAKELVGTEEAVNLRGIRGKGKLVKWHEDVFAFISSIGICYYNFARTPVNEKIPKISFLFPSALARLFYSITGVRLSPEDVLKTGERIVNLERVFNARRGYSRKDDTLPERFLKEPMPEGPLKGEVVKLEPMLDEYYQVRGWDIKNGNPVPEKLRELGLEDSIKDLKTGGK